LQVHPLASGPSFEFVLTLRNSDAKTVRPRTMNGTNEGDALVETPSGSRPFLLSVHDPSSPADLRNSAVKILPGREYTLLMRPTRYHKHDLLLSLSSLPAMSSHHLRRWEVTKALAEKDLDTRACRSKDDVDDLTVFSAYSRSACTLECEVKAAASLCGGCVPVDYPQSDDLPICQGDEVACFKAEMAKGSARIGLCK